jgi:hypothetical protein
MQELLTGTEMLIKPQARGECGNGCGKKTVPISLHLMGTMNLNEKLF